MTDDGRRAGPTDDAIRAMIEARAERAGPIRFDPSAVAARAVGEARTRPSPPSLLPRVAIAAASVAAAVVLGVVIALPLGGRPASAPPSNVSSAPIASGSAPVPSAAPQHVLSPDELGELVTTRAAELDGTIVAVRGRLEADPSWPCVAGQVCANTVFAGASDSVHLLPVGDIGPGPWDGSGPKTGVFAVRITARVEGGRPLVEFVGDLVNRDDGSFVLSVPDILSGAVSMEGAYAAVDGWLVRTPLHPCGSDPHPPPGPTYGCPDDDWLTETEFQPLRPDGSTLGPADAVYLPVGSYEQWAPDPAVAGFNSAGVEPRRATYLLWRAAGGCGPNADCLTVPRWRIAGRFDPIPDAPALTPQPPASDATYPGGIPRSIGDEPVLIGLAGQRRVAEATDATPFLVAGWYGGHGGNMCSGGIGPRDPNPLGARGCPRFDVEGLPGRPYYPPAITLPEVDGPVVLRVHTHDPGAETCWFVETCRQVLVVDAVAWSGDPSLFAAPFGPRAAISQLLSVAFADERPQADRSTYYVDEDIFTLPIACPAPWPTLLFAIHGEPRLGLLAVFPDTAARTAFQSATEPATGAACIADPFPRPGPARWVARDNLLILVFGDEATAAAIQKNLDLPVGDQHKKRLPLPEASQDLSLETMTDYLAARAAGETDHAAGERLALPQVDEQTDRYREWQADTLRRDAANAIEGTVTLVTDDPSESDVGADIWRLRPKGSRLWLYRVDYPNATDPALATETFVVIQDPASTFRDWILFRVGGEAYPTVTVPPPATLPPGVTQWTPGSGNDGSGDTPCLPAGQECGG